MSNNRIYIIIAAIIATVGLIVLIFFAIRNSNQQNTGQQPQTYTNQLGQIVNQGATGAAQNSSSAAGQSSNPFINNFSGSSTSINSNRTSPQTKNSAAGKTASIAPSAPVNNSPAPAAPQPAPLNLPTEVNFDNSIFTVAASNDLTAAKNYSQAATQAVAGFDLVNNNQAISAQYRSMNQKTLQQMQSQLQSAIAALLKIPVPANVLGMAQRYYLAYSSYDTLLTQTLALFDASTTQANSQQKIDALNQTAITVMNYLFNLKNDIQTVSAAQ